LIFALGNGVLGWLCPAGGLAKMRYRFEDYVLDTDRRELHRGSDPISLEPKVFDLLAHLVRNRERVVSKDDMIATVWDGRTVSESTLTTCINGARCAIGDSGDDQRLIKTLPRKGIRARPRRTTGGRRASAEPCGSFFREAVDCRAAISGARRRRGVRKLRRRTD
jgi:DNA-binding winged helix-turn-helix (wHTH) protein